MQNIYEKTVELAESDKAFVLCRIIYTRGSTPRSKGASMTVDAGGGIAGSVGGGKPEYDCITKAREMLSGNPKGAEGNTGKNDPLRTVLHFDLYPEDTNTELSDSITLPHGNIGTDENIQTGSSTQTGNTTQAGSATQVGGKEPDHIDPMYICGGEMDIELILVGTDDRKLREELIEEAHSHKRRRVVIFGGGHVAQALVPVLARIDFSPVVFEERPEFAKKEIFPDADEVICGEFAKLKECIDLQREDYAAIMTRGHQDDYTVLKTVLSTNVEYCGLMGSRSKRKYIFGKLREDGFTDNDIARIHNPIGIDIGSDTPGEIAISIAAELIAVRSGVKI